MRLAGKVALFTAAAQGIGKAIALHLEGADIIAHALPHDDQAYATLEEVTASGRCSHIVFGDIRQTDYDDKVARILSNILLRRTVATEDVADSTALPATADSDYITGASMYAGRKLLRNYGES